MSAVAIYVENLEAFPADRCKRVHEQLVAEGLAGIECIYALVWPNYEPPNPPRPQRNREIFETYSNVSKRPVWAWFNARADQAADAAAIASLERTLNPFGWLLDIEGEWSKGAKLQELLLAVPDMKPKRVSLAGTSASHVEYDYRGFERWDFEVEWQAYWNSNEGPRPDAAVQELYSSEFVIPGWEYRHRVGSKYGWGAVKLVNRINDLAHFDSYLIPGTNNLVFGVIERAWGWTVDDRILWPTDPKKPPVGLLMGRAPYSRIRVALNTTRPPVGTNWEAAAASAKIANSKKRGVAIYLGDENLKDETIFEIARGAA